MAGDQSAWESFLKKNNKRVPLPGERKDETDETTSTAYTLVIQTVEDVAEAKDKTSGLKTEYEVHLTLFDLTYKTFFGRTWVGPAKPAKTSTTHSARLHYNLPVYFHTTLMDSNIVAVVEITGTQFGKNTKPEQFSCGWGIIRLFKDDNLMDASRSSHSPVQKIKVFHGSSRALLYLGDDIESNKDLRQVGECQVCYTLRTHKYLSKVMHLLPENVLVGGNERVPGVAQSESGDNFRKPRLLKKFPCIVDRVQISLQPSLEKFEEDLCRLINADRLSRDQLQSDTTMVTVSERRLQVGVHNGWTYVDSTQPHLLTVESGGGGGRAGKASSSKKVKNRPGSGGSLESSLVLKNRIFVGDLVEDPLFAIVFQLEYVLSIPVSAQDKKKSASLSRAQTHKVALHWVAWTPFADESPAEVVLNMQSGAMPSPDSVLVFRPPDADAAATAAVPKEAPANLPPGKLRFLFKLKREKELIAGGGSRPNSAQSIHSDMKHSEKSTRLSSHLEVQFGSPGAGGGGLFPSNQSLNSPSTAEGSYLGEMMQHGGGRLVSGKPPLPGSPRRSLGYWPQQQQQAPIYPVIATQQHPQNSSNFMEIKHLEASMAGRGGSPEQLQELPFTPVHAPIIVGPHQTSGPGLSRAAYARLYQAGFQEMTDREGDPPEVVDPLDYVTFDPQQENADPLQVNEIILQFLAFSRVVHFDPAFDSKQHKTVFFTFQFYRYPQVTTERLLLAEIESHLSTDSRALPCVLKKITKEETPAAEGPPGLTMRYNVDPAFMKPGEGPLFVRHLYNQTLHIDVWDGDSLLLVGSAAVPLKYLLRCGRSAVQVTHELDIITTEYGEDTPSLTGDLARGGSIRPVGVNMVLKGKLHLRMANIGYPVDVKQIKAGAVPTPKQSNIVVQDPGSGAFLGGSLTSSSTINVSGFNGKRSYRAAHMAETDRELATALMARKDKAVLQEANREADSLRQRKLARMQAIRQGKDKQDSSLTNTLLMKKEEKTQRLRDLKTIELYRERSKHTGITQMLQSSITTQHTIHPSFGHAEFFEFVLKNPYNVDHTISIQCEDPDLSVVADLKEWRYFKQVTQTFETAVEENMFSENSGGQVPGYKIFLRRKEAVNIPFKYQSFKADHTVQNQGPHNPHKPQFKVQMPWQDKNKVGVSLISKNVKVYFKIQDNKSVALLSLNIEPQPHIVDQTFRFHHPEQTFLKKSIRLPPFAPQPGEPGSVGSLSGLKVRCSDPNVICEARIVMLGEPQDVFLKVSCGASPSIKKFFVLIYGDHFMARPVQTWQFYVHALQRVDVNCVEGQTSRFSLILKGTQASRHVRCCSSHPNEMQISPSESFMLMSNALHEIHLGVRPANLGNKFLYINVVDVEYHQLIQSWLVCVTCKQPVVSKAFEIQLPVGGGKGSNKRITYNNPYPQRKVFNLMTNRDDLLQFKETRIEIGGNEAHTIGLRFAPSQQSGSADVLIFINDAEDKNEETFSIRAIYS